MILDPDDPRAPEPKDAPSDVEIVRGALYRTSDNLRALEAMTRIVAHAEAQQGVIRAQVEQLTYAYNHAEALEAAIAAFVTVYRGTDTTRYSLDEEVAAFNRLAALTGPGEPEDGDTIDDHLRRAYERDRAGTVDPLLARCPTCGLTYQRTHDGLAHVRCPDNFHDQVRHTDPWHTFCRHTAQPTPSRCPKFPEWCRETAPGHTNHIGPAQPTPSEGNPTG